ncbi:MAG TPA: hypothetical protein V6D29_14275 [Leptolyngbyaceae cyanobacterium]
MNQQLSLFNITSLEPTTTASTAPQDTFSIEACRDCPSCYELLAEGADRLIVRSKITGIKYWLIRDNGGLIRFLEPAGI